MIRIGVIGIVLKRDKDSAMAIQNLLSSYSEIIVGRMGVPDKERNKRNKRNSQRY